MDGDDMGGNEQGASESLTDAPAESLSGAFGELPEAAARLVKAVTSRREPMLASRLQSTSDLPYDDRVAVERHLADELMPEFTGPDWEPTEYGLAIEDAIDRFIARYPIEHPRT